MKGSRIPRAYRSAGNRRPQRFVAHPSPGDFSGKNREKVLDKPVADGYNSHALCEMLV